MNLKSMLNYSKALSGAPIDYYGLIVTLGWPGWTMKIFGNPDGVATMENPAARREWIEYRNLRPAINVDMDCLLGRYFSTVTLDELCSTLP